MSTRAASRIDCDVCVAGGGPAGLMAGLLFARAGLRTVVLEKHADFLRDFRGDTVHPSTLEIMHELGLLDGLLQRPHDRLERIGARYGTRDYDVADFSALKTRCPFIAFMPQWEFLDFLALAAGRYPGFALHMSTEAEGLVEDEGTVRGVRAASPGGPLDIHARLTIGADGRASTLRDAAGLATRDIGAPIDVLWFRLPRRPEHGGKTMFNAGAGNIVITIDRTTYWQCAFVIPKGSGEAVRREGLDAFKARIAATVPELAGTLDALADFDEVKLLTVRIDRLERWSKPGLLMIGDAAHAMSPVGGVGINLAIQDAVAAANLFAGALLRRDLSADDLDRLRQRRLLPVRVTQFVQVQAQRFLLAPVLADRQQPPATPLPIRLASRMPSLRRLLGRMVGLGARPEHVRSPSVPAAAGTR